MHVFNITDQNNVTLDGFTIRDASAVLNTTKNVNATSQTTVSILVAPTQPTVPAVPTQPTVPEPAIDGFLSVTSTPSGADIAIDGRHIGEKTPHTALLMPGPHTIKLTLAGYQDWTKEVQVKGGETTNVHATLSQATGAISVTSTPSGASISLDGVPIRGITPYTIPNVDPGYHTIKLTLAGYQDWTETVSVTAGKTVKIGATLASISGSATITSTPSGAAIYVKSYLGDSYMGKTPHTDTAVPPGDYTITLTLEGYQDCTKEVQVKGGETTYVHAT